MPNTKNETPAVNAVEVNKPGFLKRNWKKIVVGTVILAGAAVIGGKKYLDHKAAAEAEF